MADQQLTFRSWVREQIAGSATGTQDGRALVQTSVTLSGTDAGGGATTSETRQVRFLLAGPGDVVNLAPGAIVRRYPAPGAVDHESDRCAHVEFADPSLPWRYAPAPAPAPGTGATHPWLVLVVGLEGSDLVLGGDQVTLDAAVQQAHPLGAANQPYPWAHVQDDAEGRRIARVVSGRPLEAGTDYLAVLVPAFDAAGQKRWTGAGPATVPVYDHWRFRTATPAGSFEDLAAKLQPGRADSETGRAPLDYPRVPAAGDLQVRGALAPIGATDLTLDADVRTDLAGLRTPASDDKGRPIVGLPRYGGAWRVGAPEETTWGETLNTDPRDRGVAGLGLELGIQLQEELSAEASTNLGALAESRQRIRDLVLGLRASTTLWGNRLPADPADQLWLLGPALRRVVTPDGSVADLATAGDRALPTGLFSTAVRRMLRTGPARTSLLQAGGVRPGAVLRAANRCPPESKPTDDGLALDDLGVALEDLEERRRRAAETGEVDLQTTLELAERLAEQALEQLQELARAIVERLADSVAGGEPAPWAPALDLLVAATTVSKEDEEGVRRLLVAMRMFLETYPEPAGENDLVDLLTGLEDPRPKEPQCHPVDLDSLAEGVVSVFDPTGPEAPSLVRVLSTIDGLDPTQPLAPPEVCVGLDRPVWADVQKAFAEWLLPGVGALPEDSVIAVETNPRFVDSLLVGMNEQLVSELRWRNIPVATGCTPLRVFWDRAHTSSGARVDDVVGIHSWSDTSDVGAPQHRPPGASGRDLVVVVRGRLFLRYPATVVYLVTAVHGDTPDFDVDPDPAATRVFPAFQGRIGADVAFFGFQGLPPEDIARTWLVLEEPPAGYRFANDVSTSPQPHTWAAQAFARPVRVLVAGDRLDPEGPP